MEEIIRLLYQERCSCIISNGTIRLFRQKGVADLYELWTREPGFLKNASVADKVIGKAAAALLTAGKVKEVYADVISQPALHLLQEAHIKTSFKQTVDHIENRNQTGWCPLEALCYPVTSLAEILSVIRKFIEIQHRQNRFFYVPKTTGNL